jgi:hypothetical protein
MWLLCIGLSLAGEESERSIQVGLGAGLGSNGPYARFDLGGGSSLLAPVGSLRLLVADKLILEPSISAHRSLEHRLAALDETEWDQDRLTRELYLGLSLKPLLLDRSGTTLYPLLSIGRLSQPQNSWTDWTRGSETRIVAEGELIFGGSVGVGIQRWMGPDWTVSIDIDALSVAAYSNLRLEDEERYESRGLTWGFQPTPQIMVHHYW